MAKACPICGHELDYVVVSHKATPFVDGKCYATMCFTCFQAPIDYEQVYDENGDIAEILGPFYTYKKLHTAEELVEMGSASDLKEAKRSLAGVKAKVKEADKRKLDKLTLSKPDCKGVLVENDDV